MKRIKRFFITVLGFALLPALLACGKEENNSEIRGGFKLTGIVKNVGEVLEVEIIESDYAFGIYWVLTPAETEFADKNGKKITRLDLVAGDLVEIEYGGQVMMSYPPKIVAKSVKLK